MGEGKLGLDCEQSQTIPETRTSGVGRSKLVREFAYGQEPVSDSARNRPIKLGRAVIRGKRSFCQLASKASP